MKRSLAFRALYAVPILLLGGGAFIVMITYPRAPDWLEPAHAWDGFSSEHPLGCGEAGVDLLALVAHAEVHGILLAAAVALFGFGIGMPLGVGAGLARGVAERFVERVCDLLQGFPTFLLAMAVLASVRTPNRWHLGIVFALTAWTPFTRLALLETRVLRDASFVDAAYALGLGRGAIFFRHILPNLLGVVAVQIGASAAAIVVSEAALAFVGLGPRDGVSLGSLLDQGVAAMLRAPHVLVIASLAIFMTKVSFLLAGRVLEPPS